MQLLQSSGFGLHQFSHPTTNRQQLIINRAHTSAATRSEPSVVVIIAARRARARRVVAGGAIELVAQLTRVRHAFVLTDLTHRRDVSVSECRRRVSSI